MDGQQVLGGRYRVGAVLGRGGMATVHAGHDDTLGRAVAIKIFRPDVGDVDHDREVAEIRVLARLSHPNLVTLYDAHLPTVGDYSPAYIVMELVTGPSLATLIAEGSLTPQRTAQIGADLGRGLAAAHAAGVVHSDVKPANVLLTPSGTPKLADFGIASLIGAAQLTGTGQTLGTPAYLSPEQITAAPVTGASDVYSLGLVLLECLTGQRAYPGTGMKVAIARLQTPPVIPADLPAGWAPLLARMTNLEPRIRPTPAEVTQVLSGLASTAVGAVRSTSADATTVIPTVAGPRTERLFIPPPLEPVVAARPAYTQQPARSSTGLVVALVAAIVVIIAGVGLGVYLSNHKSSTDTPVVTPTATATSSSPSPTMSSASPTPSKSPSPSPSPSPTPSKTPSLSPTPSDVVTTTAAPKTTAATAAASSDPVVVISTG